MVLVHPSTTKIKLIGLTSRHPELAKSAVTGVPIVNTGVAKGCSLAHSAHHHHHVQTAHGADHHHHSLTELLDLAEILRGALKLDPCLPVRSTLEEACYLLGATHKIDRTDFLADRARQCVEIVRAIQEEKKHPAATAKPAKAGRRPAAKSKATAKVAPAAAKTRATAKVAPAMPTAATRQKL